MDSLPAGASTGPRHEGNDSGGCFNPGSDPLRRESGKRDSLEAACFSRGKPDRRSGNVQGLGEKAKQRLVGGAVDRRRGEADGEHRLALRFDQPGQRSYSPTFMYRAIADGSADVITAFSSDGRIASLDLVTLTDPRRALPSYDAVLLVAPGRAGEARFLEALRPLLGAFPVERMRQANLMVDRDTDKRTPAEAARWLDAAQR